MRTKEYTIKEFQNILKENGFIKVRITGSHATYKKDDKMITIVLTNKTMNKMICRRLIKENNLIV